MNSISLRQFLPAFVAALAVLLAAWFFPLPAIMSGEEQLAPQIVPQTRDRVWAVRDPFLEEQAIYNNYIKTHDLSALLNDLKAALTGAKADPSNPQKLEQLRYLASRVVEYTGYLQRYGEIGERYFPTLRAYDDDLMAWTRALRAQGEILRDHTWPVVEHSKEYPVPFGEVTDPQQISASTVATQSASLQTHIAALDTAKPRQEIASAIDAIEQDVAAIWESGRAIEYVDGKHEEYYDLLRIYHAKVLAVSERTAGQNRTGNRLALANGLNLLVGVITLAGLAALFMPRQEQAA